MTDEEIIWLEEIFFDAYAEILQQNIKWGQQDHPDGTHDKYKALADAYREVTNKHAVSNALTWVDILLEEVFEAAAATDSKELNTELTQCVAVIMQWLLARRRNVRR